MIDRYGRFPESVEKLLRLVEIKTICKKLHIIKVYVFNGDIRLDVEKTTPISLDKITDIFETGFIFISEYCLGLNLKRKNWKEDMLSIAGHLKMLLSLVKNEK